VAVQTAQSVKLTVNLPSDAVDAVERLADRFGKTKTQVLREAIALKVYLQNEVDQGNKVLIERNGALRELAIFM
jgi:predicted transcriptional regulator